MAKVVVSFDAEDLTPVQKYTLLTALAELLDKTGVAHYDIKENPAEWSDFSDIKVVVDSGLDTLVTLASESFKDLMGKGRRPE